MECKRGVATSGEPHHSCLISSQNRREAGQLTSSEKETDSNYLRDLSNTRANGILSSVCSVRLALGDC